MKPSTTVFKGKALSFLCAIVVSFLFWFPALNSLPSDALADWTYDCASNTDVEVIGAGMGYEVQTDYNPQTLSINNVGTVQSILAQTFARGGSTYEMPAYVEYTSGVGQDFKLYTATDNVDTGLYYEQILNPASWIKTQVSWIGAPQLSVRDFTAYITRQAPPPNNFYNTGRLPHKFIWYFSGPKTWTESFIIPQSTSARTVYVTFAVSDERSSTEYIANGGGGPVLTTLTAEAGGISQTATFDEPDPGQELLLKTITLNNVSGTATSVNATVTSPDLIPSGNWPRGDSLFWSGVNVRTSCVGAVPPPPPPPPPGSECDLSLPPTFPSNKFHACFYSFSSPSSDPFQCPNGIQDPNDAFNTANYTFLKEEDDKNFPSPVGAAVGIERNWLSPNPDGEGGPPGGEEGGGDCTVAGTGNINNVVGIWRGQLNFQPGTYTFHTLNDDGARLTIEGSNVPLNPVGHSNSSWGYNPMGYDPTTGIYHCFWTGPGNPECYSNASSPVDLTDGNAKRVTFQWYNSDCGCSYAKLWWDYVPAPQSDWFQVGGGGDVHVQGDLTSSLPTGEVFSDSTSSIPAGIVSAYGTAAFSSGSVSNIGWLLSNPDAYSFDQYPATKYDYAYFDKKISNPQPPQGNPQSWGSNGTNTYIKVTGDLTIDQPWNVNGNKRIVVLVENNLIINRNITIHRAGEKNFLMLIVKGNITINPGVTDLQGVFIADGQIDTGLNSDLSRVLLGKGIFVAHNGFNLQRKSSNPATIPAERFDYDPNLIMQGLSTDVVSSGIIWQEVAP